MSDPILNTEALRWLLTGEVGVSSKFIVARITGFDRKPAEHPWDTGDFMRCEKMLRSCPSIRARFSEMVAASPEWAALVASWDAIRVAIRDGHHGAAHDMIEAAVYRRGT